jgi:hypothetical protein
MSGRTMILIGGIGLILLVAVVGSPKGPGTVEPGDPAIPDQLLARWMTASGAPVEWIEGRRANESAGAWLARGTENVRSRTEALPPAGEWTLTEPPGADLGMAPRLQIGWSDSRGIRFTATLHKAPWASPEFWALDCWLAASFIERYLAVAEQETTIRSKSDDV